MKLIDKGGYFEAHITVKGKKGADMRGALTQLMHDVSDVGEFWWSKVDKDPDHEEGGIYIITCRDRNMQDLRNDCDTIIETDIPDAGLKVIRYKIEFAVFDLRATVI